MGCGESSAFFSVYSSLLLETDGSGWDVGRGGVESSWLRTDGRGGLVYMLWLPEEVVGASCHCLRVMMTWICSRSLVDWACMRCCSSGASSPHWSIVGTSEELFLAALSATSTDDRHTHYSTTSSQNRNACTCHVIATGAIVQQAQGRIAAQPLHHMRFISKPGLLPSPRLARSL